MKNELFVVGPEAVQFKAATVPFVSAVETIIANHKAGVSEITRVFDEAVRQAKARAESVYDTLCANTEQELRDTMK